jgi:hypothetical protein
MWRLALRFFLTSPVQLDRASLLSYPERVADRTHRAYRFRSMLDKPLSWACRIGRFVRNRALIVLLTFIVVVLVSAIGQHWMWWLELPVHFQLQFTVILSVALALLATGCVCVRHVRRWDGIVGSLALLSLCFSLAQVLAFTPAQRALAPPKPDPRLEPVGRLRILSANVYSGNYDTAAVLSLIKAEQPDLVLLLELTSHWRDALSPLAQQYP